MLLCFAVVSGVKELSKSGFGLLYWVDMLRTGALLSSQGSLTSLGVKAYRKAMCENIWETDASSSVANSNVAATAVTWYKLGLIHTQDSVVKVVVPQMLAAMPGVRCCDVTPLLGQLQVAAR
eukprot:CAMPEP_0115536590 /NCGR_PEP_ID=MMETSP0271-20121206/87855_1 /TAXON_ID=71861 /ORGANISM="Scrippsiella trochoidea, Strain CCMP3099" /LENGTH=121 /DNA_ID=CAMNT_0002969287 /DNA_START=255 /DNA_END=615 /DNA_ORIENTATION=-